MRARTETIPLVGHYRGVGIHNCQSLERIETVVKPEIDAVFAMDDIVQLADFAADVGNCPEARLLAGALVEARWMVAAEDRKVRPSDVDIEVVRASTVGLDSQRWRNSWHYCSLLDTWPPGSPGAVPRPEPLERVEPGIDRIIGRSRPAVV
jgi:hypothetical protein